MSWLRIMEHWALVEADMHEHYGVDLSDAGILDVKSWRWLNVRVGGLLAIPSRLISALAPEGGET